ncbi:MAG: ribosome assembly RNA-binding protein YhbY [Thiohalospira sp.]
MPLNPRQRQFLRRQAHHLKPVVTLGQAGLSEAVAAEADRALTDHELIKVRIAAGDRDARAAMSEELARLTAAETVQVLGRVVILYRAPAEGEPKIALPR